MKRNFQEDLINAVKDAGQDLVNNAEEYVGKAELLSSMTITINFDPEIGMRMPVIDIDKEYLCKAAYERLNGIKLGE